MIFSNRHYGDEYIQNNLKRRFQRVSEVLQTSQHYAKQKMSEQLCPPKFRNKCIDFLNIIKGEQQSQTENFSLLQLKPIQEE